MQGLGFAISGIVGATAMLLVMNWIHHREWAYADMVRTIGGIITGSEDRRAYGMGLFIHYSVGIVFAFVYSVLLGLANIQNFWGNLILTSVGGFGHGLIVGLVITISVGEHHPIKQRRGSGVEIAAAHVIGHTVYGLALGLTLGLLRVPIPRMGEGFIEMVQEVLGYATPWVLLFGAPILFVLIAGLPWLGPKADHATSERK